jgi:hypothetical protein
LSRFSRLFFQVLLLTVLWGNCLWAQPAPERSVSGTVTDAGSNQPISGATVALGGIRTTTDRTGHFTVRVPEGTATIDVTAPKYFPLSAPLEVRDRDIVDAQFALAPDAALSATVDVVATAPAPAPAVIDVQPTEVLRTPGALDNVFRTLQTLPGVAATDEFGSRLAVRGGSPDQNLTIMDGAEIHDPYRLFGLTSAFNPETIRRFELSTGGFSPKYGDRLSSLLTIENRDGDSSRRLGGTASLSITDANVVLEGGLPRDLAGSWLVTARRTYYDVVASKVADQDFPSFGDLQAKGVWEPSPGRKITLFGLRSRQSAALNLTGSTAQGEFNDNTRNDLAWIRFDGMAGGNGRTHTIASYSNTWSKFGVDAAFQNKSERSNAPQDYFGTANVQFSRQLSIRDYALRQELAWALGTHVVETGVEVHHLLTGLRFVISGDRNTSEANGSSVRGGSGLPDLLDSSRTSTRGGAWLVDTWHATSRTSVEAGFRVDRAGIGRETTVSPRVSASQTVTPGTRLKIAAGRYTQSPGYEKFVQSDYVLDVTAPEVQTLHSERSNQFSLGLERDLLTGATVRVEGYYKQLHDLLIGRLETEQERLARVATYDFPAALAGSIPATAVITTVPTNDGAGRAYGLDVFLTRTAAPASARLRGWASYTLGQTDRLAYGRWYPFEYDRRHAMNAVVGYKLSANWELSATVRLASGFPRTPPLGVRVASREDVTDVDGDGNVTERVPARDPNGLLVYGVSYGGVSNLNTARLPMFARVDLRATWRPRGGAGRWEVYAEVINLLNRKNAGALTAELAYNPLSDSPAIVEKPDQTIPRLPTVGLRFRF